jgi:hypothetical protein
MGSPCRYFNSATDCSLGWRPALRHFRAAGRQSVGNDWTFTTDEQWIHTRRPKPHQ